MTACTAAQYARGTAPAQKNTPPRATPDFDAPAPSRGPASCAPVEKTTRPTATVQSAPPALMAHSAAPATEVSESRSATRTEYARTDSRETVPAPVMSMSNTVE